MRFIGLIFLGCCFFSCGEEPKETRAERIAKGISECSATLLNLNKQAANAPDSMAFEAIQAEFEKAKTCIVDQRMKPEDLAEVKKVLALKYPALAAETELLEELMGN